MIDNKVIVLGLLACLLFVLSAATAQSIAPANAQSIAPEWTAADWWCVWVSALTLIGAVLCGGAAVIVYLVMDE